MKHISGVANGRVLLPHRGFVIADVRIARGVIVEVGTGLLADDPDAFDAAGAWVLPAAVDAHVHFNEPGRTHWEGFESGSRALAAGGCAAFIDMPLNSTPAATNPEAFCNKRAAGEHAACIDFALWGGIIPGNLHHLPSLAELGAVGFKAFFVDSGVPDFPAADPATLVAAMRVASQLGLPVAVHAEDPKVIASATASALADGRRDASAFLASRPKEAEIEAVRTALDAAGETGCALHVVHAGCPEVVELVSRARDLGTDATVEVCYHHALLDFRAAERQGAAAKCAPPLRSEMDRSALFKAILDGQADTIGSDHSPAPPEMKSGTDFFAAWGGIAGCQHGLLLLASAALGSAGDAGLAAVWHAASERPARRFGLSKHKGSIAIGADADLVVLTRCEPRQITAAELLYRHAISAYLGMPIDLRVDALIRAGVVHPNGREGLLPGTGRFLAADREGSVSRGE